MCDWCAQAAGGAAVGPGLFGGCPNGSTMIMIALESSDPDGGKGASIRARSLASS